MLDQRQDSIICGIGLTGQLPFVAVTHILLRNLVTAHFHNAGLYHILNILYVHSVGGFSNLLSNVVCNCPDLIIIHLMNPLYILVCLPDCILNLGNIKRHFLAVSFSYVGLYFHFPAAPLLL